MEETMMTYIIQEEKTCKNIIYNYRDNLEPFQRILEEKKAKNWLVLATGSSYNAILSTKYYIERHANVFIQVVEPFTFYHYERLNNTIDLVIAISQSGRSKSTINALQKVKQVSSIPTVVLTSNLDSPIEKYADAVIDIGCGVEKVGFVTNGFTSTVLTLMLIGLVTGKTFSNLSERVMSLEIEKIKDTVERISKIISASENFYKQYWQELVKINRFAVIGYGPTFGTAKESETKFTETIRVPTQGFELEAYMHGPYLEVNQSYGLIFIFTDSDCTERAKKLKNFLSSYTDHCFSVTCNTSDIGKTLNLGVDCDEYLSPLVTVIPFQVLSYLISTGKRIDLNKEIFSGFDLALSSKE